MTCGSFLTVAGSVFSVKLSTRRPGQRVRQQYLSWVVDLLLPLVQEASNYLIGWSSSHAPAHHFAEPLVKRVLPLLAFGATVAFLIFNAHRNARSVVVASVVPGSHLGLILHLSDYQPHNSSGQSRCVDVVQ